jgi:SAM-dependent methyltransferase
MFRGVLRTVRVVPGVRRVGIAARFGDAARTAPLTNWGTERGTPVDRWYIERYLEHHSDAVTGRVLEVKDDAYATRFGAADVEILDIDPSNSRATVVGDLCDSSTLEPARYDCAIVTQTLQLVADPSAAVRNLLASLRPGGTLITTVPCLSRVVGPMDQWRWTPAGWTSLLDAAAPSGAAVDVAGLGNGLAARAFLFGLAAEDLLPAALAVEDADYPLIVGACVRVL